MDADLNATKTSRHHFHFDQKNCVRILNSVRQLCAFPAGARFALFGVLRREFTAEHQK